LAFSGIRFPVLVRGSADMLFLFLNTPKTSCVCRTTLPQNFFWPMPGRQDIYAKARRTLPGKYRQCFLFHGHVFSKQPVCCFRIKKLSIFVISSYQNRNYFSTEYISKIFSI